MLFIPFFTYLETLTNIPGYKRT